MTSLPYGAWFYLPYVMVCILILVKLARPVAQKIVLNPSVTLKHFYMYGKAFCNFLIVTSRFQFHWILYINTATYETANNMLLHSWSTKERDKHKWDQFKNYETSLWNSWNTVMQLSKSFQYFAQTLLYKKN